MPAPITLADLSAFVNKRYSNKPPENLSKRTNVFLTRVKKEKDFTDDDFEFSVIGSNAQGIGARFDKAQSNKNAGLKGQRFSIKRAHGYGVLSLATEAVEATEGFKTSFVRAKVDEFDSVIAGMIDDLAWKLYEDGTGVKATYAATPGAKVISLQKPEHAKRFGEGERIQCWDVSAAGYMNGGAVGIIDEVDEDAGTITLTANVAGVFDVLAVGDYLVREGEYTANPFVDLYAPVGLAGWVPAAAPAVGESFWGADRSKNPTRYAGTRISLPAGTQIKQILTKLGSKLGSRGAKPNLALMSHENFERFAGELDIKKAYQDAKEAGAGFSGLKIHVHDNTVEVLPDTFCPSDRIYMLDMASWYWKTTRGGTPFLINPNGLDEATADGKEWRWGYFGNLRTEDTRAQGVAVLTP
jgi:hypothetical protein